MEGKRLLAYIRSLDECRELVYPEYIHDTVRLQAVIKDKTDLSLSRSQAESLWIGVSDEYCAGWLMLPKKDSTLWKKIIKGVDYDI